MFAGADIYNTNSENSIEHCESPEMYNTTTDNKLNMIRLLKCTIPIPSD